MRSFVVRVSCALAVVAVCAVSAHALDISSRPCPYSCQSQGLAASVCRDWQDSGGRTCFVAVKKADEGKGQNAKVTKAARPKQQTKARKGGGKGG